ncbi:MAG: hypothetical protein H7Z16_12835 [Pyrinomonadaceae bacterium]|nr:hypothetical protein [Pyrinomonadaceae bacterium]
MTHEELIQEINQLPRDKRKALGEAILRNVKEEQLAGDSGDREQSEVSREEKIAAFHRLRGMLKTDGPPPTDEKVKDDYINYLAEKYS